MYPAFLFWLPDRNCCTLIWSPGDPGERGRGIAFYPKAWRSWKTGIALGHVFGVWLSGTIKAMALKQVWDSAGPADTGINININSFYLPETWVDIASSKSVLNSLLSFFKTSDVPTTDTHWISESGIMDFFVFLGPKPHDVSHQYATITGTMTLPPVCWVAYITLII